MTSSGRPRLIAGTARLDDKPRKPTKQQRLLQARQVAARKKASADSGGKKKGKTL